MSLKPMTYEEALALVRLMGGAGKPTLFPADALNSLERHAKPNPLHKIYAMLTERQRRAFMVTINHVWPKPQRLGQRRPVDPLGLPTKIENWDQAWATALSAASRERKEWYAHNYDANSR